MKKTDTVLKIMTVLAFCAMVTYLSIYVVHRFLDPVRTALTVTATMSDSATVSGLVIRDELLVESNQPYIETVVSDGEKVSAGQVVARSYETQEALSQAMELRSLERQIAEAEETIDSAATVYTSGNRDDAIFSAVESLSAALKDKDYVIASARENTLQGLLFQSESTDATAEYLRLLQDTYSSLAQNTAEKTVEIPVGDSGTFSAVIDGYEGVAPEYAKTLSPSTLRELIAADRVVDESIIGKLITSYRWYYAAIVPRSAAENLQSGMTVRMSFGRYYSGYLTADVEFVGRAEGNEQLILFSMDRGFDEMLTVRAVSAEIIYSEYTGLRVPLTGLYRYYAGYVSEEAASFLSNADAVTLHLGERDYAAYVSEIGTARAYGDLPEGVEAGSEEDTRPKRCQVVLFWPWEDTEGPDFSAGSGTITAADGETELLISNYYDYDPEIDRMCVFTMTGMQSERKKVTLVYAGTEYALVSSSGTDALREGNEVIIQATALYNGKIYQ